MGAGHTLQLGEKLIVVGPKLPNGCTSCDLAVKCADPVRTSFETIRKLSGIAMVDRNKAVMPVELANQEPYNAVLIDFDTASKGLKEVLDRCDVHALDVYEDGVYLGIKCGATQEVMLID